MLRAAGSTAALVVIYYLLPLDRSSTEPAVAVLLIGLVALIGLITFQVRSILISPFPGLRAVEALATSLPLFLLLFASTYLVIATEAAGSFSQQLTHTDALYFTVTVFSTVGFGDITATTEAARLLVTCQSGRSRSRLHAPHRGGLAVLSRRPSVAVHRRRTGSIPAVSVVPRTRRVPHRDARIAMLATAARCHRCRRWPAPCRRG